MKIARLISFAILTAGSFTATLAEIPDGYYRTAENQGGKNLLLKLHDIIDGHHDVGYDGLWQVYYTSDVREDGTLWDMYSTKHWQWGNKQCGNYKVVGDCYNREHSFPKSWFSEGSPMKSDAFHVYPTDGKVNGQRSNYPYGECANGTTLAANGSVKPLGRLGSCTFPGYTGTVFEPDDEYKGDFARTYFYMATRYNDKVAGWSSPMLAGNNYPAYTTWAVNLLLKWHEQDPVSDKEVKRNDAVYVYQGNRNPYIDHPELVDYIWGSKTSERWMPGDDPDPTPGPGTHPEDPDDPVTGTTTDYTHTFNSGDVTTSGGNREWNGITWTTTELKYTGWNNTRGAQLGSANNSAKTWSMTTEAFDGLEIEEVTVTATCAGGGSATVTASINGNEFGSADIDSSELKSCTFTNGGKAGKLTITFTTHAAKAMYLHTVSVKAREPQSGLDSPITATPTVTATDGGVIISTGNGWIPVSIYSADGICWFEGEVAETERFSLERGIYIVRAGNKPYRVLVK